MARSDRRWQGYHLARPADFWLSDGTLEVRIQVQINNQVFSLLTRPPSRLWPRSSSFHALTSKSERKQSSQSPEDNRREEARPPSPSLSLSQHLSSFISFSSLLLHRVWYHIPVVSSLPHRSPHSPSTLCPFSHPASFPSSTKITKSTGRAVDKDELTK